MIPEPEQFAREFFTSVHPPVSSSGYAVLPYIKELSESLTQVLRKYDIRVFNKPVGTLKQDFHSLKDRPKIEKQTNVVYKISCKGCSWSYIGETGRCNF